MVEVVVNTRRRWVSLNGPNASAFSNTYVLVSVKSVVLSTEFTKKATRIPVTPAQSPAASVPSRNILII